jgi:uncharacterized membrane protein YeaQ/YmgE (transglycosylase-associated protein family)
MIYSIIVGLVAGWLAGQVMKGGGYGVLMDIVLGLLGGIMGGWLLDRWASGQQVASSARFWFLSSARLSWSRWPGC